MPPPEFHTANVCHEAFSPWMHNGDSDVGLLAMVGVCAGLDTTSVTCTVIGLPFAASLTRVVVSDWIYAWTRNPMILSALAFLVGLGLWLHSGLFLVWALAVVSPAVLVFLQVYEERELEIRFGDSYLAYKEKTPILWPRRPKDPGGEK